MPVKRQHSCPSRTSSRVQCTAPDEGGLCTKNDEKRRLPPKRWDFRKIRKHFCTRHHQNSKRHQRLLDVHLQEKTSGRCDSMGLGRVGRKRAGPPKLSAGLKRARNLLSADVKKVGRKPRRDGERGRQSAPEIQNRPKRENTKVGEQISRVEGMGPGRNLRG